MRPAVKSLSSNTLLPQPRKQPTGDKSLALRAGPTLLWPVSAFPIPIQGHKASLNGGHTQNMVYGDTRNACTERSSYFYDQPSHIPSVSVPAQRCHSPLSAGQEAWEPISADAQMEKQAGINWEMRAALLVLLCFCLCKEEEMFVKPISQNGLPLTAGGPAKPPAGTFCPCTRSARVSCGTFAEYHLSRKKTQSVFNCVPTPIADCSGFFLP